MGRERAGNLHHRRVLARPLPRRESIARQNDPALPRGIRSGHCSRHTIVVRPQRNTKNRRASPTALVYLARRKWPRIARRDRKSTRLNSSHDQISYAVFCLKKKKTKE